jgi:stress-induced morphogen
MPIPIDNLQNILQSAFPDADITIQDMAGDDDHYSAVIQSHEFLDKTRIQQHQMVYNALKGTAAEDLHALALKTIIKK